MTHDIDPSKYNALQQKEAGSSKSNVQYHFSVYQ